MTGRPSAGTTTDYRIVLQSVAGSDLPRGLGGFNPPNNFLTLPVPRRFELLGGGVNSTPPPLVQVVIGCRLLEGFYYHGYKMSYLIR